MLIDPDYNCYYVYTALFCKGIQISCGACPVLWENDGEIQKAVLTWADGNYHLYGNELSNKEVEIAENAIYAALNEHAVTFGKVVLSDAACDVCWCLLEEPQVGILMDFPELLQAA
jgi:hypothetical protein